MTAVMVTDNNLTTTKTTKKLCLICRDNEAKVQENGHKWAKLTPGPGMPGSPVCSNCADLLQLLVAVMPPDPVALVTTLGDAKVRPRLRKVLARLS